MTNSDFLPWLQYYQQNMASQVPSIGSPGSYMAFLYSRNNPNTRGMSYADFMTYLQSQAPSQTPATTPVQPSPAPGAAGNSQGFGNYRPSTMDVMLYNPLSVWPSPSTLSSRNSK